MKSDLELTSEEWQQHETLELCPECRKISLKDERICKCNCETKHYWQVYDQFKPYVPVFPEIGKAVSFPELMIFKSSELIGRCDSPV